MQIRFINVIFSLLLSAAVLAQTAEINGVIVDETGEGLPNVNILITGEDVFLSELSDTNGRFKISVPVDTDLKIEFSFIGKTKVRKANLKDGEKKTYRIVLPLSTSLGDVNVDGENRTVFANELKPKLINKIPSINNDISSVVLYQGLGVSVTSELGSSYNVRGGNFDENLVYVNDIEVYRPFLVRAGQQEGLSFPNPDMINSMQFSSGGFEARYGDKLSSVLDIQYTRPSEFSGSVMASLLGGSLHLEDQSKNELFTYNTGFRYKSNSYVLGSLDTQGDYNPNYIDFQTYLTYRPAKDSPWNFDVLGNYSRNRYNFVPQSRETNIGNINEALRLTIFFDGQERSQFETGFGAISANYIPSYGTLLKFQLSAFKTQESETFDILGQYFLDELERDLGSDGFGDVLQGLGVGSFLEHGRNYLDASVITLNHKGIKHFRNEKEDFQKIRWGVRVQRETIDDQLREWVYLDSVGFSTPVNPSNQILLNDVIIAQNKVESMRTMAYAQYERGGRLTNGADWTTSSGIRANYWTFNNDVVVSPRAVFSYKPNKYKLATDSAGKSKKVYKDILYKFSAGYYYQPPFYREMRRFNGSINETIKAQRSIHVVAGTDYNFKAWDRPFKFKGELFYKRLGRIIPYEIDNVRIRYYADDIAKGYTAGADFLVNGEFIEGIQSWVRVSFLSSKENIENDSFTNYINTDGDIIVPGFTFNQEIADSVLVEPGVIRRPTDQAFTFSMFFQDEMPSYPDWKVQLTAFYGTNLPYGPPGNTRADDILKTPPYRRVDVGLSRTLFSQRTLDLEKALDEDSDLTDDRRDEILGEKHTLKSGFVSLEFFNLLGINNTINYTWIEAVNGRQYAIPNFLTGRRINLKLVLEF